MTVVDIRRGHVPPLDSEEGQIEAIVGAMRLTVDARVGPSASFGDREVAFLDVANEACRRNMQLDLQSIAESHGKQVLVNGVLHKEHELGTVNYHSLCGTMKVSRRTYRLVGKHNGPTLVPLDLQAAIIDGATPALALAIASGCADAPDRQCEEQLRTAHRKPPSRSTIERIAKSIGGAAKAAAQRIETVIREHETLPAEAHAISAGLDRTSAPMEEPRPEDAAPPTGRRKRTKPYVRAVPERIDVNYRMAYVGTVSVVDRDGQSLVATRYAASAEEGPDGILARMMGDVRRHLDQKAAMPVGITQDGSHEMWNLTRAALLQHAGIRPTHEVVDRYHFDERRAEVLRICEPDPAERRREAHRWQNAFDTDDGAIDAFAEWLSERMAGEYEQGDEKKLEGHWTFIFNNNDRLRYASVLKAGLPQGSGTTEGSCKSLVMARAKRSGQRWHTDGLDGILTLRGIKLSQRLPTFWPHFAQDYAADIAEAA